MLPIHSLLQGPSLWPAAKQAATLQPSVQQGQLSDQVVLLTDGRGGLYLTTLPKQQQPPASVWQPQPPASPAAPAQQQPASGVQGDDAGMSRLLAAIDASEHHARVTKRARTAVPPETQSPQRAATGSPAPQGVELQPHNSDDESAHSSGTLARSSLTHSSLSQQQVQQYSVQGEASATSHGPAPMYVRLMHTPQGTIVLPSNCAVMQQPQQQHQQQQQPQLQLPTASLQGPAGLPLAHPLQVPAGMLLPTPVGYELHPAQPSSHQAQAVLDPSTSFQQLAASPTSQVLPTPWSERDRAMDKALNEIMETMLHKPRGRPVKYIDLGVNRMALKYHVGLKVNGRVESIGATDSELAAQMLLDLAKIGLGLYREAAHAAPPSPSVHPEEQSTSCLNHHTWQYSTNSVQRVVSQLINRNLVATSELLHAYTRAHAAGCKPGPCLMSVAAALGNTPSSTSVLGKRSL